MSLSMTWEVGRVSYYLSTVWVCGRGIPENFNLSFPSLYEVLSVSVRTNFFGLPSTDV